MALARGGSQGITRVHLQAEGSLLLGLHQGKAARVMGNPFPLPHSVSVLALGLCKGWISICSVFNSSPFSSVVAVMLAEPTNIFKFQYSCLLEVCLCSLLYLRFRHPGFSMPILFMVIQCYQQHIQILP